jgi:hypothetical protein
MKTDMLRQVSRTASASRTGALAALTALATFGCVDSFGPDTDRGEAVAYVSARSLRTTTAENVALQWNEALLQSIRTTPIGPPQTARALALVHTSMYDAWAAYDAVALGTRLGDALRRPQDEHTEANKAEAVSYAAYRMVSDLFPSRIDAYNGLLRQLGYDPARTTNDTRTAAGVGNVAAEAVIAFAHADGSNQLAGYTDYTAYEPFNSPDYIADPERWQPLRNPNGTVQTYVAPHWQNVIPFGLTSGSQFRPAPPAPYQSGEYHRQVQEVIDLSAKLTDREKVIVEYWADGPQSELPPGHWNLFAQFVSRRDGHTLDDDVKMFFILNNALCDASIAAWDAKRSYDYVRPITAVRYLKEGKKVRAWGGPYRGTQVVAGESWLPYQVPSFITPPFAEYVSGHSTFSAASAEVLRRFTGSDYFGLTATVEAGSSRVEPGAVPARTVVLSWSTFSQAADEAGISRRYGGIHFRQGDLEGRALGRRVGAEVWHKAEGYIRDGSK